MTLLPATTAADLHADLHADLRADAAGGVVDLDQSGLHHPVTDATGGVVERNDTGGVVDLDQSDLHHPVTDDPMQVSPQTAQIGFFQSRFVINQLPKKR